MGAPMSKDGHGATPLITSVICTYNRYDFLEGALNSLLEQDMEPHEFEIVVVDNSPDFETASAFQAKLGNERVKYLIERVPGLSNARNVALRTSQAEIVHFLDDDAVAKPDLLQHILEAFDFFGEEVAAVGGQILPRWGAPRPSWLSDNLLGYLTVVDWGGDLRLLGPTEWIAGANIAFRREPILKLGAFSTDLGRKGGSASLLSNEEAALIERIAAAGLKSAYAPAASVDHFVSPERLTRDWFRRRVAWQAVSDFIAYPERATANVPGAWRQVSEYLMTLPPRERSIGGLFFELEESDEFKQQMDAVYNSLTAILSGKRGGIA